MDLTASSAVNLPMTRASLRLVVVWMGNRSIRRTYCGTWAPPRFTFTTNFIFFMFPSGIAGNRLIGLGLESA